LAAETNQRICFLNVCHDEVIRSLFYNKNNDSLITVSVYASDNFSSLKCRSTRIEYVPLFILLSFNPPIFLCVLCFFLLFEFSCLLDTFGGESRMRVFLFLSLSL